MFRLKLFGSASIEGPDGPVTGRAVQRRRLALLALLAVARERGVTRDKLIGYLWPDADPDRGRHMLSDSVYRINQAVGGEALIAAGEELRLNPDRLPSDVWEFGEAVESRDWERAARLHAAPFLDGFFLTDARELELWVDAQRERLSREYARALESLAEAAERDDAAASGAAASGGAASGGAAANRGGVASGGAAANRGGVAADAVHWWRALAAHDPFSSRIALRLMRALERAGETAAALQHARAHTLLLHEELGLAPDADLLAFVAELRDRKAQSVPPAVRAVRAETPAFGPHRVPAPDLANSPSPAEPGTARIQSGDLTIEPGVTPTARSDAAPASHGGVLRFGRTTRLAVIAAGIVAVGVAVVSFERERPAGSAVARESAIAVLPFADLSPGGEQEHLADGIAEELMARLGSVDGLAVVGRTSAFAFKGRAVDVREIATRLNVTTVLEGSVNRSGNRLRIVAKLIDARNGYQLWTETYDREVDDVFDVQDEISREIVARLRGRLTGEDASRLGERSASTDDAEAFNLFLKGRYEWHRRTEQSLRDAVDYFSRAVERAPDYARAHAGLGDAYAVLGFYDFLPPREAFPAATASARRALELDPSLAEPHATLAYAALYYDWDWPRAEREFLRAIELAPGYSTAHQWYANFLTAMGRADEAEAAMRRAMDLDPLSLIANAALGWALYHGGEYARAVDQCTRALELDPTFVLAYLWRAWSYEEMGLFDVALQDLDQAVRLSGGSANTVAGLARAHARAGNRDRAFALLRELQQIAGYVPAFDIAKVYEALGDTEAALHALELAFEHRAHSMAFLAVDPQLKSLHGDERFARLVTRVGLDGTPGGRRLNAVRQPAMGVN